MQGFFVNEVLVTTPAQEFLVWGLSWDDGGCCGVGESSLRSGTGSDSRIVQRSGRVCSNMAGVVKITPPMTGKHKCDEPSTNLGWFSHD